MHISILFCVASIIYGNNYVIFHINICIFKEVLIDFGYMSINFNVDEIILRIDPLENKY